MSSNGSNGMQSSYRFRIAAIALAIIGSAVVYTTADYVSETQIRTLVAIGMFGLAVEFVRIIRSRRFDLVPLMIGIGAANGSILAPHPWKAIFAGIGIGIVLTLIYQRVLKEEVRP